MIDQRDSRFLCEILKGATRRVLTKQTDPGLLNERGSKHLGRDAQVSAPWFFDRPHDRDGKISAKIKSEGQVGTSLVTKLVYLVQPISHEFPLNKVQFA